MTKAHGMRDTQILLGLVACAAGFVVGTGGSADCLASAKLTTVVIQSEPVSSQVPAAFGVQAAIPRQSPSSSVFASACLGNIGGMKPARAVRTLAQGRVE